MDHAIGKIPALEIKNIVEAMDGLSDAAQQASNEINSAYHAMTTFGISAAPHFIMNEGPKRPWRCRPVSAETIHEHSQQRNAKCACGSGKKFKKCCMNKIQ